jgi:hypothetical protein
LFTSLEPCVVAELPKPVSVSSLKFLDSRFNKCFFV